MVSAETLVDYPYCIIPFTVHTDASDKQLGSVIIQNNKPIAFLSRELRKPQRNYTTTEREILAIVECLKQFRGILFGYEINLFSYYNNLVSAANLSESQMVMLWRLIIEEFGPNIQNIYGFDKIVADTLSRLLSMPSDKYETCTRKAQYHANNLFALGRVEKRGFFSLNLLIVQREQQKELRNINYKLSTYISDQGSGYSKKALNEVDIICYDSNI